MKTKDWLFAFVLVMSAALAWAGGPQAKLCAFFAAFLFGPR
jgi:hypothetical protein